MDYRFGVLVQISGAKFEESGKPVPPEQFFLSLKPPEKTDEEKAVELARALGFQGELIPTE